VIQLYVPRLKVLLPQVWVLLQAQVPVLPPVRELPQVPVPVLPPERVPELPQVRELHFLSLQLLLCMILRSL
jgi:hypothetical protein